MSAHGLAHILIRGTPVARGPPARVCVSRFRRDAGAQVCRGVCLLRRLASMTLPSASCCGRSVVPCWALPLPFRSCAIDWRVLPQRTGQASVVARCFCRPACTLGAQAPGLQCCASGAPCGCVRSSGPQAGCVRMGAPLIRFVQLAARVLCWVARLIGFSMFVVFFWPPGGALVRNMRHACQGSADGGCHLQGWDVARGCVGAHWGGSRRVCRRWTGLNALLRCSSSGANLCASRASSAASACFG